MARTNTQKRALYEQIMRDVAKQVKRQINESSQSDDLQERLKVAFSKKDIQNVCAEMADVVEDDIETLQLALKEDDIDKVNDYIKTLIKHNKIYLKALNKLAVMKK